MNPEYFGVWNLTADAKYNQEKTIDLFNRQTLGEDIFIMIVGWGECKHLTINESVFAPFVPVILDDAIHLVRAAALMHRVL